MSTRTLTESTAHRDQSGSPRGPSSSEDHAIVGKSTLCRAVSRWLTSVGASVDHFEEADIRQRE
ncbi:hypothetical protein DVH02_20890 [Streptomyces corynorhini]|uniref:Uncharacterized protein n=1 Tax=Streptomyces corynorhini TaxID=2282652 RepID=A0A370B817_9ACTN|nr:hypothetical protein DVH02_20890 [Streptomyces corynorhini]